MDLSQFISNALNEDIGDGDHTSLASIPSNNLGKAKIYAKEDGIIAGIELAGLIFHTLDADLQVENKVVDGDHANNGDTLMVITGKTQSILAAERLVLNCMQRMSAIATLTGSMVKLLNGLPTKILDTRKTTPGFRYLEKWAVRIGGGVNHRFGLYDVIMIKDNHIDFAGGISNAITNTMEYLRSNNKKLQICIEARSLHDIEEILKVGGIDRIMLDNFTPELLKEAVTQIDGKYDTEATGGITVDTVRSFAESGVDYVSIGAITHSAGSMDISLIAIN
ncbi:MAG: carboxylating nicotinate-nucleotide diphosphorylase [Flavobacteriales bacterium]|nr:carboxylating nicotinate-nucleotide diphosphorylase [Flavobacteriales bacterium]